MKKINVYSLALLCFLITCTTAGNNVNNSNIHFTGLTGDIIQAYEQKDYRKVMELANQAILTT